MSDTERYELAFYLTVEDSKSITRKTNVLTAALVGITKDRKIRNLGSQYDDTDKLKGLTVRAFMDDTEDRAWGSSYDYCDMYRVDERDAANMLAILRKIRRGLERAQERYGYPSDFHSYLIRVAQILKVASYVVLVEQGKPNSFYDNNKHRIMDASGIQSWIRDMERKHGKQAHTETAE